MRVFSGSEGEGDVFEDGRAGEGDGGVVEGHDGHLLRSCLNAGEKPDQGRSDLGCSDALGDTHAHIGGKKARKHLVSRKSTRMMSTDELTTA